MLDDATTCLVDGVLKEAIMIVHRSLGLVPRQGPNQPREILSVGEEERECPARQFGSFYGLDQLPFPFFRSTVFSAGNSCRSPSATTW